MEKEEREAAWGYNEHGEARWPAAVASLVAVLLYITLPDKLVTGPIWILPTTILFILIPLLITSWNRDKFETKQHRFGAILLIAIINLYNIFSLSLLLQQLLHPTTAASLHGEVLLIAAAQIWLTNVIVFGLWYWELDRGGPAARSHKHHRYPDFLFPQMATPLSAEHHWAPKFFDYLYLAFTNATAFSPTDSMPLSKWAKVLMMVQSMISLITVALVAARAVNVLA